MVNERTPWPLFVHGPTGTGKTLGALAFADLLASGYESKYCTLGDAVRDYAECQLRHADWIERRKVWQRCELTIIDELGQTEKVSDFAFSILWQLLEDRIGRPSIWISNLEPKQLAGIYDDRIVSRLLSGTVVAVRGDDRRISRKKGR